MMIKTSQISIIENPCRQRIQGVETCQFSRQERDRVHRWHLSLPGYAPTPLRSLHGLAERLGIGEIRVKDESFRFGLNSFKAIGVSYAIARLLAAENEEPVFADLRKSLSAEPSSKITFVSATDGNHGRAVAWMAQLLNADCVVYMPFGTEQVRVNAINELGGHAEVINGNYDDAVNYASAKAETHGWKLIQDMAWEGYTSVPLWIMQGYSALLSEVLEQVEDFKPSHVFLQAGVGSMASGVQAAIVEQYGIQGPTVCIVEPENAACYFKSMQIADGELHGLDGHLETSMAGLACGTPSSLAWPIIRDYSDFSFRCTDYVTELGMRVLAHPCGDDDIIVSGESGAVTTGLLVELMENTDNRKLVEMLSLGPESKILLISTEGATDPENYRRVISQ
jgi:diaminopropionate ammonia-lyase